MMLQVQESTIAVSLAVKVIITVTIQSYNKNLKNIDIEYRILTTFSRFNDPAKNKALPLLKDAVQAQFY